MNTYERKRLHELCENVKDTMLMKVANVLEESGASDIVFTKTKSNINKVVNRVEKLLVENGYYDKTKALIIEEAAAELSAPKLSNGTKMGLAGAAGVGAGAAGAYAYQNKDNIMQKFQEWKANLLNEHPEAAAKPEPTLWEEFLSFIGMGDTGEAVKTAANAVG